MPTQTEGWALVESVSKGPDAWYRWHVSGVMLEGAGASAGQRFYWSVPDLNWDGFNWSKVEKPTA